MCSEQINQRTIRVMGDGSVSVMPDTTVLKFDIETEHPDYSNAYEVAAQGNAALRKALQELSVDPDKLKTTNFALIRSTTPPVKRAATSRFLQATS